MQAYRVTTVLCRWCCGDMEHIDLSADVFKMVRGVPPAWIVMPCQLFSKASLAAQLCPLHQW